MSTREAKIYNSIGVLSLIEISQKYNVSQQQISDIVAKGNREIKESPAEREENIRILERVMMKHINEDLKNGTKDNPITNNYVQLYVMAKL